MRWLGLVVVVGLVGCSEVDPQAIMPAGSEAMAYDGMAELLKMANSTSQVGMSVGLGTSPATSSDRVLLSAGTKARVIKDAGPRSDLARFVQIHVLDGEHTGKNGQIPRVNLLPIPH